MSTQKPRERKSMTIIFIECIGLTVKVTFKILFLFWDLLASGDRTNDKQIYNRDNHLGICRNCHMYREYCSCSHFYRD
ncbi:hypothetical protein THZG08_570001 [Vibrio owensii]|nr:hypothetical protein THZG08_570001 [Vibrio owensii]CAH1586077.1 hypothetical protein THOA03_570001 [Vibrio owensii]